MNRSVSLGCALFALLLFGCEARRDGARESGAPVSPASPKPVSSKKLGDPVPSGPLSDLAAVLKEPEVFAGRDVIVEGAVQRVCSKKGCWMELSPAAGGESCRVTFKDYGFFVPTDSSGKHARLTGQVSTRILSRAHAEHLEAEGARLSRKNPDGTAVEVQIVARGVELR